MEISLQFVLEVCEIISLTSRKSLAKIEKHEGQSFLRRKRRKNLQNGRPSSSKPVTSDLCSIKLCLRKTEKSVWDRKEQTERRSKEWLSNQSDPSLPPLVPLQKAAVRVGNAPEPAPPQEWGCRWWKADRRTGERFLRFWFVPMMILVLLLCCVSSAAPQESHHEHGGGHNATGIAIVSFKWHHVESPYLVAVWILVCFFGKLRKSRVRNVNENKNICHLFCSLTNNPT